MAKVTVIYYRSTGRGQIARLYKASQRVVCSADLLAAARVWKHVVLR